MEFIRMVVLESYSAHEYDLSSVTLDSRKLMYDSLKIRGQTVPQLHIVYTKVNISKLSHGYLAKLKSSAPQSHHNFSL